MNHLVPVKHIYMKWRKENAKREFPMKCKASLFAAGYRQAIKDMHDESLQNLPLATETESTTKSLPIMQLLPAARKGKDRNSSRPHNTP